MTQRYEGQQQRTRMEDGLCPECGGKPGIHTDNPRALIFSGCSLREDGVLDRIRQYREDKEAST